MHDTETDLLLNYIAQQRDGVINATFGLTDAQAACRPTAAAGCPHPRSWA